MKAENLQLIQDLCSVFAPSGNEGDMKAFILEYVKKNASKWETQPEIISGDFLRDCLMLKFGEPRTAIFAHVDSTGFTVRYENQLVPIGGPEAEEGFVLWGKDDLGEIECKLRIDSKGNLFYDFGRGIQSGTELVFKCDFRKNQDYIQSCYLDNRLGVFAALKVAEKLQDGLLIFSCGEEHGGGSVPYLVKYAYEELGISQSLICDITWVTDGVQHGKGVAISMRDMSIPRREYINKIIDLAKQSGVPFQIEVERNGGSDGREIQASPYPLDWCFVGAPSSEVHSPNEKVYLADIESMVNLYSHLMKYL